MAAALGATLLLCLWQRAEIASLRADLAGVEKALVSAHVKALATTLHVTADALKERDIAYAAIKESHLRATVSIAVAGKGAEDAAAVDIDGVLPLSLSDALIMQQREVCAGSGGDSPAASHIQP